MANGIIIIDKPEGWTSMDVCAKLRGVFHEKRIGHGGTLDPMATGVLPVFVGRATRAVEFATESRKEYIVGIKLGVVTNTQDTSGEILEEHPVSVAREQLPNLLERFTGDLEQLPPMYSAIKIKGKKLYELARKGQEVERKPRSIHIYALELLGKSTSGDPLLRVECSKGTYVRTLCHDLGQALGCGACMSALRRTRAAGFSLEDAVSLEQVLTAEDPIALLRPVDCFFARIGWKGSLTVRPAAEKVLRNGGQAPTSEADGEWRVYSQSGEFLGLGSSQRARLRLIKSFFEV
ncbi:MAG: tRNA pseudouridine(55) synthase TruB [Flavonifractor sp.]|nr:tRNA pseudouridine(55) synthase TruB [Flavonifractor sp.]